MKVKTELVLEQLVSRVLGRALELRSAELTEESERGLQAGLSPRSWPGSAMHAVAGRDRDVRARPAADAGLTEMLVERTEPESVAAIGSVCRELAAEEPDAKPEPGEGSWSRSRPGGHVRHFLALSAADQLRQGRGNGEPAITRELSAGEAKRCFLYGFYARCCEEAETPDEVRPSRALASSSRPNRLPSPSTWSRNTASPATMRATPPQRRRPRASPPAAADR